MKRQALILAFAAIFALAGCKQQPAEPKVMARFVPERADDFVFENNLIAGRFYGKALEGNPTSPGIDIWVKMPGKLVADTWYAEAQKDPDSFKDLIVRIAGFSTYFVTLDKNTQDDFIMRTEQSF